MRILIIGTAPDIAGQCTAFITSHWPAAQVDVPDPHQMPGRAEWHGFDAIVMGHHPPAHDGMAWLAQNGQRLAELPPVVMLSAPTADDPAVEAVRRGAADHLASDRLSAHRLVGALNDAILARTRKRERDTARARLTRRFMPELTQLLDQEPPADPPTGAPEINGYHVLRQIGEGGTSRVYLADRVARLGQSAPDPKRVVLKVVDARSIRNPAFIDRFIREYRIISTVQNEHVARIYDQGVTDDHLYIAMEHFPRGDLRARMDLQGTTGLMPVQALRLVAQIARALDAIHGAGVIHRDLKPQNIMFRDANKLALVDFGLAKQEGEKTITASAAMGATPLYMSPEQCVGRPQDARSDLYSLGVILYELLTGGRLFDADSLAAIAFKHVHAEVPRLPESMSSLQTVLDRLLAKDPDHRFQSARELFAKIAM